jgi:hypothetical protein
VNRVMHSTYWFVLALALAANSARADIFKCTLPSGQSTYQQLPCTADTRGKQLKTPLTGQLVINERKSSWSATAEAVYTSPDKTWDAMRAALLNNSRDQIQAALTGKARREFEDASAPNGHAGVQAAAAEAGELVRISRRGKSRVTYVWRIEGKTDTPLTFERIGTNWFISTW